MNLDECRVCHQKIDKDLAAIARSGERLRYAPFVRDLRTSGLVLAHAVCFATEHGIEPFVLLVHEHDYEVAGT